MPDETKSNPGCAAAAEPTSFTIDTTDSDGVMPSKSQAYTLAEYWDYRYEREDEHEWLASYDALKDLIRDHVHTSERILMLGCGNSSFSADMYEHGFKNIVNVDYSEVCVERMADLHKDKPEMTWRVMDMRDMSELEAASFDVVIDKAGMDAVLADGGDKFSPAQELLDQGLAICTHVRRVLKNTGCFISVSFGQPHFRKQYLMDEAHGWGFAKYDIPVGFGYFWYQMDLPARAEYMSTLPPSEVTEVAKTAKAEGGTGDGGEAEVAGAKVPKGPAAREDVADVVTPAGEADPFAA